MSEARGITSQATVVLTVFDDGCLMVDVLGKGDAKTCAKDMANHYLEFQEAHGVEFTDLDDSTTEESADGGSDA